MELFFDTETSDLFKFGVQKYSDDNFPWVVQLGAVLAESEVIYAELNVIIQPEGREISDEAARVHQIDQDLAKQVGVWESDVASIMSSLIRRAETLVAHNYDFDSQMLAAMFKRNGPSSVVDALFGPNSFCTMRETTDLCQLSGGPYGQYKWPKLQELHQFLFNEPFVGAHDAMFDIRATMKCYYELKRREIEAREHFGENEDEKNTIRYGGV
jgi:DNA polymerase III subunit epsilon